MKIKGNVVDVFDIEIFPNCFHCTVKDTETKEYHLFEVSNRKNNLSELISFFTQKGIMFCGYNNLHYDNPIINFILDYRRALQQTGYIKACKNLARLSDIIVNDENTDRWKKWKYANNFPTLDLLAMRFSQKQRVGLKEIQVTMKYRNVYEYEGDFSQPILDKDIPEMIMYNINDVDSTEALLYASQEDIELRLSIEKEYNIDALNRDAVNLGMDIIKYKYLEKTHKSWWEIKDLRSPCDRINLNEVILPFIKYDTPVLQNLLEEMKRQTVSAGRKGYNKHFLLDNLEYSVGVGGIHSVNQPGTIVPADDEIISDVDVASLYPSLIIKYKFYPPHLGSEFIDVYGGIRDERLDAKHKKEKLKDLTLKFAINGLSGNLQSPYSFCYSPFTVMQIRINGQLLLLMLAEKLISIGCKIIQANTDGLFVKRKKKDEQKFIDACKWWEDLTGLQLEEDRFEALHQYAVNDYLGVMEGYHESRDPKLLKKKGLFVDTVSLGKGMASMIIPKAIIANLADGVPVRDTIRSCRDINDFVTYRKVDRKFSVEYDGRLIQHINRYYCSTKGKYLYTCIVDDYGNRHNYTNVLTSSGVVICNNLDDFKEFPDDINYEYYETEANKIILALKTVQLSLF